MSDEQLHRRMINKRMIAVAILLILISCGLWYYYYSTSSVVTTYSAQKSQESSLQSQLSSLESTNASLRETIEQTGKELVSFTDDKIKYVNLASELSENHDVSIGKLTVSDVWTEGQMAGMTVAIEAEGTLSAITDFVNDYCNLKYTNRINVVSCRPVGRYPWMTRGIDGELVLDWFDLSSEFALYDQQQRELLETMQNAANEAGIPSAAPRPNPGATGSEINDAIDGATSGGNAINGNTGQPENGGAGTGTETPVQDPTAAPSNFGSTGPGGDVISSAGQSGETFVATGTVTSNAPPPSDSTAGSDDQLGLVEGEDYVTPDSVNKDNTDTPTDKFENPYAGAPAESGTKEETPITLNDIFSPKIFKVYLEIDFLGRE